MINTNMILYIALVLTVSFSYVSAECKTFNSTVEEGRILHDTGCHQTLCKDGQIVKKKVCPEGFTMIKWGGHRSSCLRFINERMDWGRAWAKCSKFSVSEPDIGTSRLVEAPNKFEFDKILSFADRCVDKSTGPERIEYSSTTSGALIREINKGEEESILDRWALSRAMRQAEAENTPCGADFTCESGDECAANGTLCDGMSDCSDNSDEEYCGGTCEFWMGAHNMFNPNVIAWKVSNLKVKRAPVPERAGLCLGIAFGSASLFDCDFEGLYPLCEVCSSNHKVDNGCEYNGKLKKDGEEVDTQDCGKLYCKGGEIKEEFHCAPGYKLVKWKGASGCYKVMQGSYTYETAKKICKAPMGIKKLAAISGEKEGEAVSKFLKDENVGDKEIWIQYEDASECTVLKGDQMTVKDNCKDKAMALCESCFTESEQGEADDSGADCTYMGLDFDKGDQIEPNEESCSATVCEGDGQWENKYFGHGCCNMNSTIIKPGVLKGSKEVAEKPGDICKKRECKDGTLTDEVITCGCKGSNGDIYPDNYVISEDKVACKKVTCKAGKQEQANLPISTCSTCQFKRYTLKRGEKKCYWINKKRKVCNMGTCNTFGRLSTKVLRGGNKCRNQRRFGCR